MVYEFYINSDCVAVAATSEVAFKWLGLTVDEIIADRHELERKSGELSVGKEYFRFGA